MATTTAKAIRDVMITAVEGITPSLFSDQLFLAYREDGPSFLEWCEQNAAAALRRFSIRDNGGSGEPLVDVSGLQQVEREFQCVVAYPRHWQPGDVDHPGGLGLDDHIESDETQLIATIGTPGYSTIDTIASGDASVTNGATSIEEGEACRFLVIPLRVLYYRAMP